MTNDQGDDAGDPEAAKRDVAAALLGSSEWQQKLAAAREARAKVLAARTTDPERRLKEALAKTAEPHRARSANAAPPPQATSPQTAPPPQAAPLQATPPLAVDSAPSMPGVADRPAPPRGAYADLQSPPRRRRFSIGVVVGLLFGLLLGVGLGAGALAYLARADQGVDIQTWLRGVLSEARGGHSDLLPAGVEISPAPVSKQQ